jgi:sugar (pentulose or hexulose) kinase
MHATPVIAIFDVGKTNKKLFLFDAQYRIVYEESTQLPETADEDGFPCEDVQALTSWIKRSFQRVTSLQGFTVKAVNVSAYGASFVYVDEGGNVLTPLYNYLKPYPEALRQQFFTRYGGEEVLGGQTASPVLGSLNSGLQLYRLKYEQPWVFEKVKHALHLPQYLSYLISHRAATDVTSVGCHTLLWDFEKKAYHDWLWEEGLIQKFAPLLRSNETVPALFENKAIVTGIGLHDSSAALIPYLSFFHEPFVLISTGTWCISLNPFNHTPLTGAELKQDCLCYLTYEGKPVKASRLFAGSEHEQEVKRLAAHYNKRPDFYVTVRPDLALLHRLQSGVQLEQSNNDADWIKNSLFAQREVSRYATYEEAYHQLMLDIMAQQVRSTQLVLNGTNVKRIFVDGGFSKNPIYMHLLAAAFPHLKIFAASMAEATAMGAAVAIHASWDTNPFPNDIIELKCCSVAQDV